MKDLYLSFPMRYQQLREKQTRGRFVVAKREKMRVINSHAALYARMDVAVRATRQSPYRAVKYPPVFALNTNASFRITMPAWT